MDEGRYPWVRAEGPWIGHAFRGKDDPPGRQLLEDAIDDAYRQAKSDGYDGYLLVDRIWVRGENPISEYRVQVLPGG